MLQVVPITFKRAKEYVAEVHRHHKPPVGHKFSIGLESNGELCGVAMTGRPVARAYDDGYTLEVTRTATDGTGNANSMLYGAVRRAAKAMGYRRVITYTRSDESGASLRAAGWVNTASRRPRKGWDTPSRPREDDSTEHEIGRELWEVRFDGA